jgi:hypothetical protein
VLDQKVVEWRIEMRAYCFTNYYLSSIQHGIQSAHALVMMAEKYRKAPYSGTAAARRKHQTSAMFWDWATNHKTMVVLNVGNHADMRDAQELVINAEESHGYPCADFYEDNQSLHGLLTCVAIVIPEPVIQLIDKIRKKALSEDEIVVPKDYILANLIAGKSLAR